MIKGNFDCWEAFRKRQLSFDGNNFFRGFEHIKKPLYFQTWQKTTKVSFRRELVKLGNMFFISLQKLLPFLRKSNFSILVIQISWCRQMPKHKTKYILLNNLGSKHSLLMKFGHILSHYKKNFIKKFNKNCNLKTSSRPFCVCKELSTTSVVKWNFWSKLLM